MTRKENIMNGQIKAEILHNLEVRKNIKSLFDGLKSDSNKDLTSVDSILLEVKISSLIDGSIEDIWFYLFYLQHTGYLSFDELSHIYESLKNVKSDLVDDSKGLAKLIKNIQDKIDPKDVKNSIKKLEEPKDIYEKYIIQRALFKFGCFIDLD